MAKEVSLGEYWALVEHREYHDSTKGRGEGLYFSPRSCQEIGCTRRFLERRIQDGELRVFRPSSRLVRIAREDLNHWVAEFSHGGRSAKEGPAT
ncbi:MAG: hypothetical protein ACREFX_06900 [Opitutaceae bacterium]